MAKLENGTTTYFHQDHLSARVLTNANGTVVGELGHYPGACPERSRRGEKWYETGTTTKQKFTTYERDGESGNDYTTGRMYASNLGRFLSPDLAPAALGDPQSWNRYTYVRNDPVNQTDPSGWCGEGNYDPTSSGSGNCGGGGEGDLALLGEWADPFGFLGMQIGTEYTFSGPAGFPFESYGLDDLRFFAQMGNDLYNIRFEGMSPIFSPSMFWFGSSGPGGGGSGGNPSGNDKPWEFRSNIVALLRAKNDCSDWFNKGTGSAADVMSHVPINLVAPESTRVIPGADAWTGPAPMDPIVVDRHGRFYPDSNNGYDVGPFRPGTYGARMIILLHELAHKVLPPGFISNDDPVLGGAKPGTSEKNTETVTAHCLHAILQ